MICLLTYAPSLMHHYPLGKPCEAHEKLRGNMPQKLASYFQNTLRYNVSYGSLYVNGRRLSTGCAAISRAKKGLVPIVTANLYIAPFCVASLAYKLW